MSRVRPARRRGAGGEHGRGEQRADRGRGPQEAQPGRAGMQDRPGEDGKQRHGPAEQDGTGPAGSRRAGPESGRRSAALPARCSGRAAPWRARRPRRSAAAPAAHRDDGPRGQQAHERGQQVHDRGGNPVDDAPESRPATWPAWVAIERRVIALGSTSAGTSVGAMARAAGLPRAIVTPAPAARARYGSTDVTPDQLSSARPSRLPRRAAARPRTPAAAAAGRRGARPGAPARTAAGTRPGQSSPGPAGCGAGVDLPADGHLEHLQAEPIASRASHQRRKPGTRRAGKRLTRALVGSQPEHLSVPMCCVMRPMGRKTKFTGSVDPRPLPRYGRGRRADQAVTGRRRAVIP